MHKLIIGTKKFWHYKWAEICNEHYAKRTHVDREKERKKNNAKKNNMAFFTGCTFETDVQAMQLKGPNLIQYSCGNSHQNHHRTQSERDKKG